MIAMVFRLLQLVWDVKYFDFPEEFLKSFYSDLYASQKSWTEKDDKRCGEKSLEGKHAPSSFCLATYTSNDIVNFPLVHTTQNSYWKTV